MIGKKISHYKILEKLGSGGMGVVYKAEDLNLGRNVALKFLPPELSSEEKRRKRFIQEAKAASSLDHPNLCTIHEIDQTDDGQMFISMAYYEGITLRNKIDFSGLTFEMAVDIAVQIANGLAKAHDHGIVHRDIKPANVMLLPGGLVKILDFGLAKLSNASQITEAETAVGTISYMSPEQALGKNIDHRTDIWSWGVVLFEMISGRNPFSYENPLQFLNLLLSNDAVPLPDNQPAELKRVLSKALAKDASQRYSSISEAVLDLRAIHISSQSLTMTSPDFYNPQDAKTVLETSIRSLPNQKPEKKPLIFFTGAINGYNDLLEQMPHDEVSKFLDRFRFACEELAVRHHGFVNEFEADRIVVIFGIPHVQENDFQEAVQFAFELQASVSALVIELCGVCSHLITLRAGIHSGLALIQASSRVSGRFEITGSSFQVALALCSNAKANEIIIAQESRRLVRHSFGTITRDTIPVPGTSKALAAYSIFQDLQPIEDAFVAPYVGREAELHKLENCYKEAFEREGQFITLIGEAGVGKSRLLAEFQSRMKTGFRYLHGKCQPYSVTTPYSAFRDVLQNALDLHENFSAELLIEKIRATDPGLEDLIPLYLHLLSLQSDQFPFPKHLEGENLRLAILDALTAFVLSARTKPVLCILEDWHWADEASTNALKQIVEMLPEHRALLIVTYRPDATVDWPRSRAVTQIFLEPLESSNAKTLMQSVFAAEDISETLAVVIHDRTGGNPFFIEEICLNLKEEGTVKVVDNVATFVGSAEEVRLPETIQSLILSRLDRLNRGNRELLHCAAVIGREFTRSVVQRVALDPTSVPSCLSALRNLGLIQQVRVLPEPTYRFRHALTHEVAYDSLLLHERKHLHENTAKSIEELYGERIEEHFDLLAHHFSRSDNWQKAVEYGMQSAKKINALGQFTEALEILERSELWLKKLPDNLTRQQLFIDLMLQQERLCEILGIRDRQEKILNDLLDALKKRDDSVQKMEVYRRKGELLTLLTRFDDAEASLNESLSLSKKFHDLSGQRNALRSLGFLKWHQGLNEEAVLNNQKAVEIDRERGDVEALAADLANLGSVFRDQGDYRAGLEYLEEALGIYEKITDPVKHAGALHLTSNLHRELGNLEQGMVYLQQAMAVSTKYRIVIMQSFHLNSIANISWQLGKKEECLRLHQQAVELNRKSHYADGLAHSLRMVGETLENLQRNDEALPYLQEAAMHFAQLRDQRSETSMLTKIAAIYEGRNEWDETLNIMRRLLSSCGETQKSSIEILERMAKVCRQKGDSKEAIRCYRDAIKLLEAGGEENAIATLLNSVAILEWKSGDYQSALNDYERALEIFRSLGDDVHSGLILNSKGMTLKSLRRQEEALIVLQEALELNRRTQQRMLEGHSLATIADIQSDLGQTKLAIVNYQQALQAKRETSDTKGEAWMLYHLARLQSLEGQSALSEEYMMETERIVSDCGDQKLKEVWKELQRTIKKVEGGESA